MLGLKSDLAVVQELLFTLPFFIAVSHENLFSSVIMCAMLLSETGCQVSQVLPKAFSKLPISRKA